MQQRIQKIIENCEGEILDIGCLQHSLENVKSNDWLHGRLCENFKTVVGIDMDEDVLKLRTQGYDVYRANAEDFDLGRKFDTIVAGELIEHLSNPGSFLDCVKKHLKEEGKLILSTPNPFWIEYWIRKLFGKLKVNVEHTSWFDLTVLEQLASRHGFIVKKHEFIQERYKPKTVFGFLWHVILMPFLRRLLPYGILGEKIFVVLEVKDETNENLL